MSMGSEMKVDMKNVEKRVGKLLRKRTLHGVALTVTFSEEEMAIIQERKLQKGVILQRPPSADMDVEKELNRSMVTKLAKLAIKGTDGFTPDLTISKLLAGTDTHYFETPILAKEYADELREKLPEFKAYIMDNAEVGEDESFEL